MKEINQGASVQWATKPHLRTRQDGAHARTLGDSSMGGNGASSGGWGVGWLGGRPPLPSIVGDGATITWAI